MNNLSYYFLYTLIILLFISCTPFTRTPAKSPEEKLADEIRHLVDDPEVANAQIGVYIESLKNGKVLFRQNEHKLFVPGSNQKLYTTATALEKLSANFRFKTEFYTNGQVSDSVLRGNLLIYGKGDPAISGRFREDDYFAYFREWADSLKEHGIYKIAGNIIACNGYFSDKKIGLAWEWEDLPFHYAAPIDAISYNENFVMISIFADSTMPDSVFTELKPETDYVKIINNSFTVNKDSSATLDVWREMGDNVIDIMGGIPLGHKITKSISIENPALWFAQMFKTVLKLQGITVSGETAVNSSAFEELKKNINLIFTHYSPELAEIVKVTNKGSNNFYAEQLFKTLGAEIKKQGTTEKAVMAESEWLNSIGITENQVVIKDGSGLSRRNLVSPFATATLLRYMYYSKNFNPFYDSLPIAGVDGTLKNRMVNTAAQNVARAKTGHVSNVWCLSGYTKDRLGNDYLFVIMINHFSITSPYIKNLQDKICVLLTNYYPSE